MSEIKPALSLEQWALVKDGRLDVKDWSWVGAPRGTPSIDDFGMAAALLLGHFTAEDVEVLRLAAEFVCLEAFAYDDRMARLVSLRDRIAALLPPREE